MRRAWWLFGVWVSVGCDTFTDVDAPEAGPDEEVIAFDAGAGDAAPPIERVCADRDPLRNLYFGDLHVHTGNSFDAWVFGVHTRADDAYAFARGEPLELPPLDADGRGTQRLQLERPLDFAAVTDHAEYLAEIEGCTTPGSPAYDAVTCVQYREANNNAIYEFGWRITRQAPARFPDICRDDALDCRGELAGDVWRRIQAATEAAYDRTEACRFTTFVAYEYSGAPDLANQHRNVIFRNAEVPSLPLSFFEAPRPEQLWAWLETACLDAEGECDAMAIPHNSNWSNGNLFGLTFGGAETDAERRAHAARRARIEPVVEIMQHKGDSECRPGFQTLFGAPDELCDFEKLRPDPVDDCGEGSGAGAMAGLGCLSAYDYVRNALTRGLAVWEELGVDPFHLGIIAATDTHNGTPGAVAEADYLGHWGDNEADAAVRTDRGGITPGRVLFNPGGLAAVWATENSRDAIFDALRRREVYGTSGPRIAVRLFGGRGLSEGLCGDPELVAKGYAEGVPMGADLPPGEEAPRLVVQAARDPGTARHPGTPLQRVQIIKGWVEGDGALRQRIYEVAGDPDNGADVDPSTCAQSGEGFDTLCSVWTDPDFDPSRPAFYYARVLENPSCRWNAWDCDALAPEDRPATCADPSVPRTQQERAWTSPIWHLPQPD